jgi:glycosyltransferase involved in cell wall biosynthesis
VVHLHWLEFLMVADGTPWVGAARTWLRIARLTAALVALRGRRVGIVWTVHNLQRHEPVRPRLERLAAQLTYVLCDEVIVHSRYAGERVAERFHGRKSRPARVIPHPNYVGVFPDDHRGRAELREALGLPTRGYVYLAFGLVRRYKHLVALADRFRMLAAEDVCLFIVGRDVDADEAAALRARAKEDPRIVLRFEHLPDALVSGVHRASDAGVIAYEDVFSSGALMLALSYGLPVVAPQAGTVSELFDAPAVELFLPGGLRDALDRVRRNGGEGQRYAAFAAAAAFPWSEAGRETAEAYRAAATRRRHG